MSKISPTGYRIRDFGAGAGAAYQETAIYVSFFQSMRPCPKCRHKLNTDGNGRFVCPSCGYEDKQDVSKAKAAGLDYPWHPPKVYRKRGYYGIE